MEQEFIFFFWRFWKTCKILQKFLWVFHVVLHRVFQKMFNTHFVKFAIALIQTKITEDHWLLEDTILPDLSPSFATI